MGSNIRSLVNDENRRQSAIRSTRKSAGPREIFRKYIENPNLTVDEAIDKFVEEQTAFLRDMIEGWIRTDYERKYYSDDCLEKVKEYILFKYISESELSMQEVIDKFVEEQPSVSKKEVVRLLIKCLNTENMPKELIPKVKKYLSPKVEERADDDAR